MSCTKTCLKGLNPGDFQHGYEHERSDPVGSQPKPAVFEHGGQCQSIPRVARRHFLTARGRGSRKATGDPGGDVDAGVFHPSLHNGTARGAPDTGLPKR
jgi:hypothetical protein